MADTLREDLVALARDGHRYRQRRSWWGRFWVLVLVGLVIAPLNGWLLMLAVGVAHGSWWADVPTIGYGWATLLAALSRAAFAGGRGAGEAIRRER